MINMFELFVFSKAHTVIESCLKTNDLEKLVVDG